MSLFRQTFLNMQLPLLWHHTSIVTEIYSKYRLLCIVQNYMWYSDTAISLNWLANTLLMAEWLFTQEFMQKKTKMLNLVNRQTYPHWRSCVFFIQLNFIICELMTAVLRKSDLIFTWYLTIFLTVLEAFTSRYMKAIAKQKLS